jgi:hypothetical protein
VLLHAARNIIRSSVNKQIRMRMRTQILLKSKIDSPIAFCIVHWNAPDFLLLAVSQIELLHPNCKIYILDNGSQQTYLTSIKSGLKKFKNVTLLALLAPPKWATKLGLDVKFEWQSHTAGLQFLLNYSANQSDEIAVFIDQDCILSARIDALFSKFNKDVILIGARDRWRSHVTKNLVHASFMILQPKLINQKFGNSSFYDKRTETLSHFVNDPYHGISFKALGKIIYLEQRKHANIPLLTSYSLNETIYVWHAWYSSRAVGTNSVSIDGYPVSWLQEVRKLEYDFMMQVHKNTMLNPILNNKLSPNFVTFC